MKVNIELELPEADIIFRALNVIDPTNIFASKLKDKIAKAAKPVAEEQNKEKK